MLKQVTNPFQGFTKLFDLRSDTDESGTIESIRSNIEFKSANAWTLGFAILLASVGLNINSSSVIIGAMLISPLMGPIVGIGYSLGIDDYTLLRRSLRNLSFAVGISLLTSTLYFLLSPIAEEQSELLARTNPTFFDVLIAFIGGAVGIVAMSRKDKGNAIPGVAIATALMPPLCTVGFGIANLSIKFILGAFYLFLINGFCIALSTFLFVRYLKFARPTTAPQTTPAKIITFLLVTAAIVLAPSLYFAWSMQREMAFNAKAEQFFRNELTFDSAYVVSKETKFHWRTPRIEVTVAGIPIAQEKVERLKEKARQYGISPHSISVKQISFAENLEVALNAIGKTKERKLSELELLSQGQQQLSLLAEGAKLELQVFLPDVSGLILQQALSTNGNVKSIVTPSEALVRWKKVGSLKQRKHVTDFLTRRFGLEEQQIKHMVDI